MPTGVDTQATDDRLAALLAQRGGRLRHFAVRLLGQDAEDGLQEVLAAACRSLPQFRGEAQLSTWFHRLAVRVLCAFRRRRDRDRQRHEPVADTEAHVPLGTLRERSTTPPEHLAGDERRRIVLAALDHLSPVLREVLLLRGEGLTHAEIAAALEVPLGTVKSRMAAALVALAARLQGREELLP